MHSNRLLIDIESLGFSEKKCSIVEIGWLFCDEQYKPISGDSILIFPQEGKDTDAESVKQASDINGFDLDLWHERGAVSLPEAQVKLSEIMVEYASDDAAKRYATWACNAPFDKRWTELHFPFMDRVIGEWQCSIPVFRKYCQDNGIPTVKGTLTLAGQCKLAGSAYRDAHGALEDCYSLAGVLQGAKKLNLIA